MYGPASLQTSTQLLWPLQNQYLSPDFLEAAALPQRIRQRRLPVCVQVLPAQEQMGPTKNVPPHSTPDIVAIGSGGAQPSILTEYTQDADGYWRDAMNIRYCRIELVRPEDAADVHRSRHCGCISDSGACHRLVP